MYRSEMVTILLSPTPKIQHKIHILLILHYPQKCAHLVNAVKRYHIKSAKNEKNELFSDKKNHHFSQFTWVFHEIPFEIHVPDYYRKHKNELLP